MTIRNTADNDVSRDKNLSKEVETARTSPECFFMSINEEE
jgi:hypothetical protein